MSAEYFVHESSYVDTGAVIGAGTRIWHFCHIMPDTGIGENCSIGQNVVIGPRVRVGSCCKIQKNIEQRIATVLSHGKYIMGPEVNELEEKLAAFTGAKHVITCGNGTDALLMVLMALGIKAGDAVFTTPFSFVATSEVISLVGATPVFVDIDPKTCNIAPDQLELAIRAVKANDPSIYPLPETDNSAAAGLIPRAVIPVDLFGLAADYTAINAIARANDLFVLGDGAQSFGALYNN
ncbi:MAG: aminotransferase class I/II-fold pyridoxal phosphate-dependent enzyme, partial [Desulfobacteraceae bacterium]